MTLTSALVPALGYVRVSLAREDMLSPDIQRSVVTGSAARAGRQIVGWVEDLDETGRNFRRKVMKGIARIEAGEAREIWVYRYDRWGRNAADSLANIARVELAGGTVVSATEPLDPETAIGRYNRTNSLALAEMQSDLIGENWAAAHSRRVSTGMPASGTPRFGYRRLGRVPDPVRAHVWRRDLADTAGERYEPDPGTGPLLRELYLRYIAGSGTRRLLAWLNGQGAVTTRGNPWSASTLLRALDSGFGAGLLAVHDPGCECRSPVRCKRRSFAPGTQEAVITAPEWEAYRLKRSERAVMAPRNRDPAYPLSGLVRCSCGAPCTAAHARGQPGYSYRCRAATDYRGCPGASARRSVVEAAVLAWLEEISEDLAARSAAIAARARVTAQAARSSRRHADAVARADAALARFLVRSARDEKLPDGAYAAAKAELLAERDRAAALLAGSEREAQLNAGEYLPVVRGLLDKWDVLSPGTRRELLSQVIRCVRLTRTGPRKPARIDVIPVWGPE